MPIARRLPHRLGIIIPSRTRDGRPLPSKTQRYLRGMVTRWFDAHFPGSTAGQVQIRPRLQGRWREGQAVVTETVEEIWTYCTAGDFRSHKPHLVRLAEAVLVESDQEAIAILVDDGMELVTGEERS